jgi:hypothetical protein
MKDIIIFIFIFSFLIVFGAVVALHTPIGH